MMNSLKRYQNKVYKNLSKYINKIIKVNYKRNWKMFKKENQNSNHNLNIDNQKSSNLSKMLNIHHLQVILKDKKRDIIRIT